MKKLSRKEKIMRMFKDANTKLTCDEITKGIIKKEKLTGNIAQYLSGSISSILHSLVEYGTLKYADEKTKRGGHIYQINI